MKINLPNSNRAERRAWYKKNKRAFNLTSIKEIVKEAPKKEEEEKKDAQ